MGRGKPFRQFVKEHRVKLIKERKLAKTLLWKKD